MTSVERSKPGRPPPGTTVTAEKSATSVGSWTEVGVVIAFFVIWTIVATYPLALAPANHIDNWGDPLLNVWIPAWDLHQLAHDPLHLFDAPIFYPAPNTLALSELLLVQALEALPIVALTGSFILAYNLIVILSFILCGIGTYVLLRTFLPIAPSLVGGAAYAFSFYRVGEYSHIQILSAQWIPLAIYALIRFWRRERWRDALLFAAFVVLQVLSSFYLGLFLVATLSFVVIYLIASERRIPRPAVLGRLGVAALLTLLIVVPFSLPYFQVERQFGLTRSLADAIGGSASLRNYIAVPHTSVLYGATQVPVLQQPTTDETLFPGLIPLALSLVALVWGRPRRWVGFFLALTVFGFVLSLGPRLHLAGNADPGAPLPYALLYTYVPGFHSIRVVGRMGVIATLGIAGLAALGAAWIGRRIPARQQLLAGVALAALVGTETLAIPTRMTPVETPAQIPPVYRWLASRPDNAPALELPTIESRWLNQTNELERQGHEEYFSIFHWHPTPSGYSGFEPPLFWSVIREAQSLPSDESINFFQCIGVKYVIFHQNQFSASQWHQISEGLVTASPVLRPLVRFDNDSVYELAAPGTLSSVPTPWLSLPSEAASGGNYRGFLDWSNPDLAGQLARDPSLNVTATWQFGGHTSVETTTLPAPGCLARGDTTSAFDLTAPSQPGQYNLTVSADGVTTKGTVTVVPPVPPEEKDNQTAMRLVDAEVTTPAAKPGGVVLLRADWQLRHYTVDNYLLGVEVTGPEQNVVASSTIDPFNGALETGSWLPGETVQLGQSAILPRSLPPGTYHVRLMVRFADGATWKMAGPDDNDHDSVEVGTIHVG